MMRIALFTILLSYGLVLPATAQQSADPNLRNFYMARRQITITNDAPIINDQRTNQGPSGGFGGLQSLPTGLPKAGWMPYSSSIPSVRTALPAVNNGVPKAPPTGPAGLRGKAGNLKHRASTQATTARPTGPATVQSYGNYRGYGGRATPASPTTGAGMQSSRNVRGSLLNWARHGH